MVLLDTRVTIDEVAHVLQIKHGSAYEMVHNKLGFHKVCARWAPKQLTEVHKQTSVDICQIRIITGDETWVHHYESESKQQSMEWKHSQSPCEKKFKT